MASVTFDHVTKRFAEGPPAVDDLTLAIADREFLVLVGPSGSGKSTALRLLAGLEEITSGTVRIGDRVVNNVAARDRDIAMVFQSYALYPHMSVADNMGFALSLKRMPKQEIRQRVVETAELLGIEMLLDRKPRQLSGGQRQRVALGRAIVRRPSVFLFDEPLSNLDAKLRVQTRAEISKLHERLGTTFIYVTHDQVEAMTMATRIAVMRDGALQQVGSPRELYERPANLFVAGFIGSPAMNFFPAQVRDRGGGAVLETPIFALPAAGLDSPPASVTLGVRPEDIHDAAFVPPGTKTVPLRARVEVAELMGNEVFLHLVAGDTTFLARVDRRTAARPGDEVELAVDSLAGHIFDPASGNALPA